MGIFDSASAYKLPWQDEVSQKAEERLKKEGIQIPWHYSDAFGEDFKVLALRAGGFGAVLFVKSTHFGERIYAAKTLQQFLKNDYLGLPTYKQERIAKDFLEEALPWLEMGQHPNIVSVHLLEDIVHPTTGRNVPFIFSEFMERGDLRPLVKEKGRLSLEETFSVGLQLCEGLIHAYKHGISAHQDLKPENIMVYKDGIYKVTDFSAGVMGTPGYMAPEQVAGAMVDHRADQYAIGLIMREVLSDNIPLPFKGIVTRCLQPKIEYRFDDVSELKKELLEAYKSEFKKEYLFPEVEKDDSPIWWFNRGLALYNIGHYDGAVPPFKEALKRLKAIPGTEIYKAGCLANLGSVYQRTGRFPEAEVNYKDALRVFKAIHGTEIDQARCLMNMGIVYGSTGRFPEAEVNYKDALRMFELIRGTEIYQASCLMNLGNVYRSTGRFPEAEANHKDALRMFKVIPGTERSQARCLTNLGSAYQSVGRFPEAEVNFKDALRMFKVIPGMEIDQAGCLMNLGVVHRSTGNFPEAKINFKDALRMFKAISGTEIDRAGCFMNLGNVYQSTDRFSKAEVNYKDALRMFKLIPGMEIDQARCLMNLGDVYQSTDRFSEAETNFRDSLRMFKAIPGTEIDQARCLANLGNVYQSTGRFSKAEVNYKDVLRMFREIPGTEIDQARCLANLGNLYSEIGEFSKARSALEDALEICKPYPMGTEQIKNACLQLKEALRIDPNNPTTHYTGCLIIHFYLGTQ